MYGGWAVVVAVASRHHAWIMGASTKRTVSRFLCNCDRATWPPWWGHSRECQQDPLLLPPKWVYLHGGSSSYGPRYRRFKAAGQLTNLAHGTNLHLTLVP